MHFLWGFLVLTGVFLLALWINSYVGISKMFATAGQATI